MQQLQQKNRRTVFEGRFVRVEQWEQKMYDGQYRTFEQGSLRLHSAMVLATVGEKILVQEQLQPSWPRPLVCLPGGAADSAAESALDVAMREMQEETGYVSEDWSIWKVFRGGRVMNFEHHVFIARNCQKVSEPVFDGGEQIETKLMTLDDLIAAVETDRFRHMDLVRDLLLCKIYPEKRAEFEKLLFG